MFDIKLLDIAIWKNVLIKKDIKNIISFNLTIFVNLI